MADGLNTVLNVEQIRTMIAIAEQGTFNRAAIKLGVSQSAVNQQVGRIEERVGRRLFERTKAGVSLNNHGEAVLVYSRAVADLAENLHRQLATSDPEVRLRIGLSEDFARTALPGVLGLFARRFPGLRLEATSSTAPMELFDALDRRELDVVVGRQIFGVPRGQVLWTGPTAWVGSPDLQLPIDDPVPLVMAPIGGPLRAMMLDALQGTSRRWRVAFESSGLATLEAALRAGLGVAACPVQMEFLGVVNLGAEAGLPTLPRSVFVYEQGQSAGSEVVEAFCDSIVKAARLSFAPAAEDPA